jgi:3-phosphoshikimate 1-carboxyvinyltransferase
MKGTIDLPGDKSISHRVAMLAAIARGKCRIENFNTGADCLSTLNCLRSLGISAEGNLVIEPAPFRTPDQPLDCGNSGSTIRMLTGLLAGRNVPATLIGDVSLLRRPMRRLAEPLRQMGAVIELRDEEFAPVLLREGVKHSIQYTMPAASAQVKSALLFAGLDLPGMRIREPYPTRDHTERLFEYLELHKRPLVVPSFEYAVPGDASSAAFFVAGALLKEGSDITIRNVLANPHRTGYLRKLYQSGAQIEVKNRRLQQNELVADICVRSGSTLHPIRIEPEEVPSLIDEIPVLSLLGTMGGFHVSGAMDLRQKESDRIEAMVSNLQALGIKTEETEDGYSVYPGGLKQGIITTYGDHRIAMTFAVAGMEIDDPDCIKVSFPEFFSLLNSVL